MANETIINEVACSNGTNYVSRNIAEDETVVKQIYAPKQQSNSTPLGSVNMNGAYGSNVDGNDNKSEKRQQSHPEKTQK